jgi:hypothetical protein
MRTGFFVDQLLIPGASYVGRFGWAELNPGVRSALVEARPGDVHLLTGSTGKLVVARVMPTGPPALLGETEYATDSDAIWAVLSVGPTDLRLLGLEVDVDTEDLAGICQSKKRMLDEQLLEARSKVAALPPGAPVQEVIQNHANLTSVLSLRGEMAAAIAAINDLAGKLPAQDPAGQQDYRDILDKVLGILELRRGEVDNCLLHHNREMCLFPLSEAARHRLDDGARRAAGHFADYLERNPDDLEVRWLLNIAAMTLGTYPDKIPERLRIGPEAFASPVDLGRFWDVAGPAGVAYSDNAGGSVTDDFDRDGLLDIVVSSRDPCEALRLYRNRGDGGFEEVGDSAGLSTQLGGLNVTQVDYDNDGRLDLFVMRGGWETAMRNSLLRNRPVAGSLRGPRAVFQPAVSQSR